MSHNPNNYNRTNNSYLNPSHTNQEQQVIIERHYVPISLYNQVYLNMNTNHQYNQSYDEYDAPYYNNTSHYNIPHNYANPYYNGSYYDNMNTNHSNYTPAPPTRARTNVSADTGVNETPLLNSDMVGRVFDILFPIRNSRASRRRGRTGAATSAVPPSTPTRQGAADQSSNNTASTARTARTARTAGTAGTARTARTVGATGNLMNMMFPSNTNNTANTANRTPIASGITTRTANSMEEFQDFITSMMDGIASGRVQSGGYSVTFGTPPNDMEDVPVGLSPQQINEYTELVNYSEEEEINCSICRDPIQAGDHCRKINGCGHYYHHNCLDSWLTGHHTCPNCRIDLRETNNSEEEEGDDGDNGDDGDDGEEDNTDVNTNTYTTTTMIV